MNHVGSQRDGEKRGPASSPERPWQDRDNGNAVNDGAFESVERLTYFKVLSVLSSDIYWLPAGFKTISSKE